MLYFFGLIIRISLPDLKHSLHVFLVIRLQSKYSHQSGVFHYFMAIIINSIMILLAASLLFFLYLSLLCVFKIKKAKSKSNKIKIAFFHPFCNDGGGGQKVLWSMLKVLLTIQSLEIAIYSLQSNKQAIIAKTKSRFNIDLTQYFQRIKIVHIQGRWMVVPQKKLTMVLHMILPLIYALKSLLKYQPDIFYDTTGFSSTLFLAKILTCRTFAYIHYPFISKDMIDKVRSRRSDYNNDISISESNWKSLMKLAYYKAIYYIYVMSGFFVDVVHTNSTWTYGHMKQVWWYKKNLYKLYPPCSIEAFLKFQKKPKGRQLLMMSLAQFRPEKKQITQINVLSRIIEALRAENGQLQVRLCVCGTTRGTDDEAILDSLKKRVVELKLNQYIQFKVNLQFPNIVGLLSQAHVGIHTMEAEHFGISVVEMLAAGLIVVAHNSAGPKDDIICDSNYLAESEEEYFNKIWKIIHLSDSEAKEIIVKNRNKAIAFGQSQFQNSFINFFGEFVSEIREQDKNK